MSGQLYILFSLFFSIVIDLQLSPSLSLPSDKYLFLAEAPGQQLTEAQTRTPLLGPSGPACTLNFSYSLTSKSNHTGNTASDTCKKTLTIPLTKTYVPPTVQDICRSLSLPLPLCSLFSPLGELSIRVIDSLLGILPRLWEFSGKTGSVEGVYQQAQVYIGARDHRFQV